VLGIASQPEVKALSWISSLDVLDIAVVRNCALDDDVLAFKMCISLI